MKAFDNRWKRLFLVLFSLVILVGLGPGTVIGQEMSDPAASGNEGIEESDTVITPSTCNLTGTWSESSFADYTLFDIGIIIGKRKPTGSSCRSTGTVIGFSTGNTVTMFLLNKGDMSGCVDWVKYNGAVNASCNSMALNWQNSSGGTGVITWTK